GDSVMAFWNAPSAVKDHPVQACLAALECQAAMKSFNQANLAQGLPSLFMRIGIHTGDALVGNIGSDTRLNYTAVGDTVNLASRLEGTNKEYGTCILISESTMNQVTGRILTRLVDKVAVKGKTKPSEIYEVLATQEDNSPVLRQTIELTHQGRILFETRQFSNAKQCYEQLLALNSDDGVARLFLQRCEHYTANPPPSDWVAVIHRDTK
ncbi:MAG: adenylate/guanylate cyclase domain-containing protein, partial [Planctomycetia bacterium]